MIDIKKALKLLDIIYVNQNESVKLAFDKVAMLAQLDAPTTSIPGPFEQFYNDVDYATRVKLYDIENRLKVLEGYNQSPYTNHLLNSHMVNYVSASPQVAGEFRIVHDKFKIVDHKLAEITKLIEIGRAHV